MDAKEKNELLLAQLVLMFQAAAHQQMGKLKNPMTDKIERDLSQAQVSIDIIDMLHAKMKGNLSTQEERLLSGVLQELKLNFVDEVAKQKNESAPGPQPLPATETEAKGEQA
ncbi:MAG TPA: DUF1844 domain-containing protein [Bacteroidota bacterium]|nr:DUF1844 domain-containing protein [Bacteroidota bacterium]